MVSQASQQQSPSMMLLWTMMYVSSEENDRHMEIAMKEHLEEYKEQLLLDFETGIGPFRDTPVEARRASFMRVTDTRDIWLLMQQDVVKKVLYAELPLPVSYWWQAIFTFRNWLAERFVRQFQHDLKKSTENMADLSGVSYEQLMEMQLAIGAPGRPYWRGPEPQIPEAPTETPRMANPVVY